MTKNYGKIALFATGVIILASSFLHNFGKRNAERDLINHSQVYSTANSEERLKITVQGTSFSKEDLEYSISGYTRENGQTLPIKLFYRGNLAESLDSVIKPLDTLELNVDTSKPCRRLFYNEGKERKSLDFYELKPENILSRNKRKEIF